MNIALWLLQTLLALHTLIGACWKWSNTAQSMPSLAALPQAAWRGLSVLELLCVLGLVLPSFTRLPAGLVPLAALCIAGEMLLFSALHLRAGVTPHAPMIYWLVVAALCACLAYGRHLHPV